MAVGDAHVFPGFLTLVLTQLFFPKPPTTFLTCFYRGEGRKYAGKKSRLNRGSNSNPPGHEFDTLTTESPGRGPWKDTLSLCRDCHQLKTWYLMLKQMDWEDRLCCNHRYCLRDETQSIEDYHVPFFLTSSWLCRFLNNFHSQYRLGQLLRMALNKIRLHKTSIYTIWYLIQDFDQNQLEKQRKCILLDF